MFQMFCVDKLWGLSLIFSTDFTAHSPLFLTTENEVTTMRQIEREMRKAIERQQQWKSGNTSVYVERGADGKTTGKMKVYLHDNHIADVWHGEAINTGGAHAIPNMKTFWAWPTRTTSGRLRALGINAYLRNGEPVIS
jgi:hypothetical protein